MSVGFRSLLTGVLASLFSLAILAAISPSFPAEAQTEPAGTGLTARYFDTRKLTDLRLTRTDPQVAFAWGRRSPATGIGRDTFSVRWSGRVEAPTTGTYTLYTQASDGVRLWVDGKLLIDRWTDQRRVRESTGSVTLHEGMQHEIKVEYYEDSGPAVAKLLWSGPGVEKQTIPRSSLFPTASPPPPPEDPGVPEDAERWSDPATWGGQVPQPGETATIPAGKTVLLDRSTPPLGGLRVDGTLLFEDDYHTLSSDWIMVHGRLQVGTEADPIETRARISLTGNDRSQDIMGMGTKVLGVMGGTLEVHGERRGGWTRLAATAQKGSSTLTLQENPGWRPGDRVAISSTDYDALQAEEATVTAVSGDTITLGKPLSYTHWGEKQTIAGGTVDERAEVALLTRNVDIEGEEDSSLDGFGGQIMVMGGGSARVEGAELHRMGQKNALRRYPIHFHMLGDGGEGSYLKDTAIHHSFNRCVTVHGTNGLNISGNTCYDHLGHGFFFEDGAEHDNVLEGNLGFVTRTPPSGQRLLPTDSSPATFWITNPDNVVRDNVAAGSQGRGFWLAFPEHPTGLSADPEVWPRRTPLGEFSGNVSHSNGSRGLDVDGGPRPDGTSEGTNYNPRANPTPPAAGKPDSDPVVARFEDFTAWKNREHGVWLRGENHRLTGATLADNSIGATFASRETFLQDSLVVGETENRGGETPSWETKAPDGGSLPRPWDPSFPIRGYEFYDGLVGVEGTRFANFQPNPQRRASALGYKLQNSFSVHPRNHATGLQFQNASRVYIPDPQGGRDGDASAVFVDRDGSVTGTAGGYVAANNPFLAGAPCRAGGLRAEWNAYACPPAEHATLLLGSLDADAVDDVKPLTLTETDATHAEDGATQTLRGCCADSTYAQSTVFANRHYAVDFAGEASPQRMRFVLTRGSGRWVVLRVPYPNAPKVTKHGCDLGGTTSCRSEANGLSDLGSRGRSAFYYDAAQRVLYLKLYAVDPNDAARTVDYEELRVEPR